jgi:SAM-dependent methyltransferase
VATDVAANQDQVEYWNSQVGVTWATRQEQLDRQLEPLGEFALDALAPKAGEHVIDIGCGAGQTTLALARRVGADGRVLGVDISAQLLEVAARRLAGLPGASVLEADAQTQAFEPGAFDAAYSRFGVMFFNDPAAAFANIRKALKPGGRLGFVCWRPLKENGWMTIPLGAARDHIEAQPQTPDPLAPGPFAFADPERVRGILSGAGFTDIAIEPRDFMIGGNDLDESVELSLRVGPLSRLLAEHPDARDAVIATLRETLAGHLGPDGVRMPGAVWIVTAQA